MDSVGLDESNAMVCVCDMEEICASLLETAKVLKCHMVPLAVSGEASHQSDDNRCWCCVRNKQLDGVDMGRHTYIGH